MSTSRPTQPPLPSRSADEPPPVGLVTISSGDQVAHRTALRAILGVSADTAGAESISLNVVTIPPGAAARPHRHDGVETAVYVISGRVETRFGPALEHVQAQETGDFAYIAPGTVHQPCNPSTTEPAVAVVAHSTGREESTITWYEPEPARVSGGPA